jgi:hypothetical protein
MSSAKWVWRSGKNLSRNKFHPARGDRLPGPVAARPPLLKLLARVLPYGIISNQTEALKNQILGRFCPCGLRAPKENIAWLTGAKNRL